MMAVRERLLTNADYLALAADPANADRRWELIDGELSEKPPPRSSNSLLAAALIALL